MFVFSSKAAVFYEIKKGEYRSIVRNMRMISLRVSDASLNLKRGAC